MCGVEGRRFVLFYLFILFYLNTVRSAGLEIYQQDHEVTIKANFSDITVANILEFYPQNGNGGWHRYESKLRHCHPMY